ncbi:MAG TPA: DUF4013 domain-containing protein [Roseiflexaceae bacterium]|nr:DUF4013 domain-containing protein [Roseiflexaceae bacterium]
MMLRTALSTIHRDPHWWRSVLIGGALMGTIVGYPWVAGFEMESLENTRNGFATPLPRWNDWANRYVIGLLAALIDILFFVLPVFGFGLLFLCAGGILAIAGVGWAAWLAPAGLAALLLYELAMFATGVAPIGRLMYAEGGHIEDALSARPLREARRRAARAIYARARLQSLPAYLPALLLFAASWLVGWPLALLPLWLALSALCYARLAVIQLYVAADSAARWT